MAAHCRWAGAAALLALALTALSACGAAQEAEDSAVAPKADITGTPTPYTEMQLAEECGIHIVSTHSNNGVSPNTRLDLVGFAPANPQPGRILLCRENGSRVAVDGKGIFYASGVDEGAIYDEMLEEDRDYDDGAFRAAMQERVAAEGERYPEDISPDSLQQALAEQREAVLALFMPGQYYEKGPDAFTFTDNPDVASVLLVYNVDYPHGELYGTLGVDTVTGYDLDVSLSAYSLITGECYGEIHLSRGLGNSVTVSTAASETWPPLSGDITNYYRPGTAPWDIWDAIYPPDGQ